MYFLRRIGSLLTDVRICLFDGDYLENERAILTNLAPLLNGDVHSLGWLNEALLPMARPFFANLKVLEIHSNQDLGLFTNFNKNAFHSSGIQQENVNILMDWLTQPIGPRLCRFRLRNNLDSFEKISQAIRQVLKLINYL